MMCQFSENVAGGHYVHAAQGRNAAESTIVHTHLILVYYYAQH